MFERLEELEARFDGHPGGHWPTARVSRRNKMPGADSLQGLLVQAQAEAFHELDSRSAAVCADQDAKGYAALEFCLARFIGVGRLGTMEARGL
jgi:hypothetical protein